MKKIIVLITILLVLILSGCNDNVAIGHDNIVLPNLSGMNKTEIISLFDNLGHPVLFEYSTEENEIYSNTFVEYENFSYGDIVNETDEIIIILYPIYMGVVSYIELPNLEGLEKDEIINIFKDFNIDIIFITSGGIAKETSNLFIEYGQFLMIGDRFSVDSVLPIIIYPEYGSEIDYFSPIEIEYDGPYLSTSFKDVDPLDPRGGYFTVTLKHCTDGDTAVFNYPQEIYNAIESISKSVRFLNMDTEETYSGGEEEWGKPASIYTCELLTSATDIILQTDPGDNLLGTYGRLLSWIWIKLPNEDKYQLLNYMVVKQGLAQVKYEFGAGETISYGEYTYNEWMHIAENYAKTNKLGQWGDRLDYYWNYDEDKPNWIRWY